MNKLSTWGISGVALALMLAVQGFAQQSPPPAVDSTPAPATDYTPAAPGTTAAGPAAQTIPPTAPATASGVESGRDIAAPDNRYGEQPGNSAAPAPAASAFPAPASGQAAAGFEHFGGGQRAIADGQRAELGVWLVENGGPGVEIRRITEGSAADLAGLQSGDVILQINGRGASSPYAIAQMIREMPAGQTAVVEYWRNGQANELEIVLQPAREPHQVAFRGDEAKNATRDDLESRTMRLEEQLATVLQELRQLRQEMAQIRTSGSGQTAIGGGGFGEATTATGIEAGSAAIGTTAEPAPATTPTTAPSAEPATEPAAAPAPATEPAEGSDDLFGGSTTEEPAATETEAASAETAPADDEAATEAEPAATESESDDLFQ